MRFGKAFLAPLCGVIIAAVLIGLGIQPVITAAVGIGSIIIAGFIMLRFRHLPDYALEDAYEAKIRPTLYVLSRDLEKLRNMNEADLAHYTKLANGSPSIAQNSGLPYELRFEQAVSYVERARDVIARYVEGTTDMPELKEMDESIRKEILSMGLPEAMIQAQFDKFDRYDELIGHGCAAFARELWEGSMKIARVTVGPDVIDAVLAQKRAGLS